MKHVWTALRKGRREVARHPFFAWLNADDVPLPDKFIFSPVMIDFIMSFADMNKWFLRYEEPRNELENAINEHTEEDATHSRFFVQNWSHLRLGDISDWSASKGLWWMFQAPQSAVVRRFGMEILKLAVRHPDPLVRFPMMEAIEICGDVFFGNTAPIAQRLGEAQGVEHIYYGKFHRDRESGHLQADESCFARVTLTAEQRRHAEAAVALVFSRFIEVLDQLLAFSAFAVTHRRRLQRELEHDYSMAVATPADHSSSAPPHYLPTISREAIHPDQDALVALLDRRMARLREHEFLEAIERDSRSPADVLRSFMPVWAIDVVGYRDFVEIVLDYPQPQSAAEQAISHWAADLVTHGSLYLQDWKALRLDAVVGWRMLDTISYYFLGDDTEVHRSNMARVKKHAMRHELPQVRWWIIYALESSKQALLERTRPIAMAAEAELGITLNYWAYRHGLLEPAACRSRFAFLEQPMSEEEAEAIRQVILTVFDVAEEQFALSHLLSRSGVFAVTPPVLAPSRISEVMATWRERQRPVLSMGA